jgi:plasmid stability protein
MNATNTHNTQVTMPSELYQAIEQQAKMHGHSVNSEIIALLAASISTKDSNLVEEFIAWETASDEDWLNMETMLANEAS